MRRDHSIIAWPHIYCVVLHAHSIPAEPHIQRNASGEDATERCYSFPKTVGSNQGCGAKTRSQKLMNG